MAVVSSAIILHTKHCSSSLQVGGCTYAEGTTRDARYRCDACGRDGNDAEQRRASVAQAKQSPACARFLQRTGDARAGESAMNAAVRR